MSKEETFCQKPGPYTQYSSHNLQPIDSPFSVYIRWKGSTQRGFRGGTADWKCIPKLKYMPNIRPISLPVWSQHHILNYQYLVFIEEGKSPPLPKSFQLRNIKYVQTGYFLLWLILLRFSFLQLNNLRLIWDSPQAKYYREDIFRLFLKLQI